MLPWDAELAGRLDRHTFNSRLLLGNPLGDPNQRPLWVYVPPGYDDDTTTRYPSVYVIQGYTGHLSMWANRTPYRQPFVETADAVFADGAGPVRAARRDPPGPSGARRRVGGVTGRA